MRLAVVMTGGLHPSGREQVVPSWLALLRNLSPRHDVHAFTLRHLDRPRTYPLAGATVHDLGRPRGRWAQIGALAGGLRINGPFDVVHAFWADPAGVAAVIAGRRRGMPVIVTCDSGEFTALPEIGYGLQRHWRGRTAVRLACRLARAVHVTTQFMSTLAGGHGYRARLIPIGVETSSIAVTWERAAGPPWRLLQVASLNRVKDHATLLHALAILRRGMDARLDLAGEDTLGGSLLRLAGTLGVADAVTFHGFVPHDGLRALHARAHLYVQSSRHEAEGMAVLEAAAAGLPIVGTGVGLVSDWAGRAAEAVTPGDPVALAAAIARMLDDPARRHALAREAYAFAVDHDVRWTAERFSELYDDVVNDAARGVARRT